MAIEAQGYNIPAIRELLTVSFMDSRDLRRFCQSYREFRPVLQLVSEGAGLQDHADVLIGYCESRLLFDELLAGLYRVNPRQYARFMPILGDNAPMIDGRGHGRYDSTPLQVDDVSVQREHPAAQFPRTGPQRSVQQSAPGMEVTPEGGRRVGTSDCLGSVLWLAGISLGGFFCGFIGSTLSAFTDLPPFLGLAGGVILGGLLGAGVSKMLTRIIRR